MSEKPPSWYCPFSIDINLLENFQPLVYLAGLEIQINSVHRSIWELLNMKGPTKDFQPSFVNVPINYVFPHKKMKHMETGDGYSPRGIIRSNWCSKHTNDIPSAVVVFFDMTWNDTQWNDKKIELSKRVKEFKAALAPHGTQVLVMLVKPSGISEDIFTTDRASSFCAASDIPPKYLYVLSHAERIQACIQRLEGGLRELAKLYYATRIKRIKSGKDKATQTPLLVRYNFKIAYFQEVRRDYIAALSNYQAANDALLSIKVTDANVQELKVIAAILNYRVCRLHLLKLDGKESKAQFDKHIRSFHKLEGNPELMFEHLAWLEMQYHIYGDLLKQFHRGNSTNIPDPVTYFMMAGKYAEQRQKYFHDRIQTEGQIPWPAEMDAYKGEVNLHYLGQRPWRIDSFSLDNLYSVEDVRPIQALKFFESNINHSEFVIYHLGIASEFCRVTRRMRTRCQLMNLMGVQFYTAKEFGKCIMLMTHIIREFGQQDWKNIIYHATDYGLRASCSEGDIPSYCNFLVILLKLDMSNFVKKETQHLLWSKLETVLNGRIPLCEPGCDMNIINWEKGFSAPFISYVEVHNEPIIECQVYFLEESVRVFNHAKIQFKLKNRNEYPVAIRKYGVRTNLPEYNCEAETDFILQPQETRLLELNFKPIVRDIAKVVQMQVAYIDIGRKNREVLMHFSLIKLLNPYFWNDDKESTNRNLIKIEVSKPLLQIIVQREPHALTNECYKVLVSLKNGDESSVKGISLNCQLVASDPESAFLTIEPNAVNCLNSTKIFEFDKLSQNKIIDKLIFLKTINTLETDMQLTLRAKYIDRLGQTLTVEHTEMIEVIPPFEVSNDITNIQNDKIEIISINEDFLLHFTIKNISKCKINIDTCCLNVKSSSFKLKPYDESQYKDVILNNGEEIVLLFVLLAIKIEQGSLGSLEIFWQRETDKYEECHKTMSEIPVIPYLIYENPLYLRGVFSNDGRGKLKKPMLASYTLFNRTTRVQDLCVLMESSESFMNAGPKKVTLRLNGNESIDFTYILFPLVAGLMPIPKLTFMTPENGALEPVPINVNRDVQNTIFITSLAGSMPHLFGPSKLLLGGIQGITYPKIAQIAQGGKGNEGTINILTLGTTQGAMFFCEWYH